MVEKREGWVVIAVYSIHEQSFEIGRSASACVCAARSWLLGRCWWRVAQRLPIRQWKEPVLGRGGNCSGELCRIFRRKLFKPGI